uniref:FERM domain-containing protein n=1 Tax=Romanomermis culicivorax TaxID=13658 RepID=A0A915HHF7_ROMCU
MGKRGGYNLNDCNFYILAVQMLDSSILQCTLKIASTGEDCMQYIMQKLEQQRNLYFGLKYKCSPTVYRWIDFRKPLKKQLMKHAYEFKLYFSVMFYVSNPELLSNSTERYCYYLQLKSDIITGRLFGPPEKSILCASYSLQAEFGDYDPLKQNEESLRNFTLLPLHMTKSAQILEGIVKQALHGHEQLKGMSQADAELAYIKEAKNFDGYGEEYFSGHDEEKAEIFLGYCLSGIVVKRIQSSPTSCALLISLKCPFPKLQTLGILNFEMERNQENNVQ